MVVLRYFFLFTFLVIISFGTKAQDRKFIDSLESNLPSFRGPDRARALYELVYYYLRVNNEQARKYYVETKEFGGESQPAELAYAFMAQGIFLNRNGLLDSAIILLEKAMDQSVVSDNSHALVRIYASIAHTYITSGKPEKGLDYLYRGLRVVNDHPDTEMEMKLRTNIPWAYLELKQYRNCIDYGLKNVRLLEGTEYEWILLYSYNNVAISYGALGLIDSAKHFIQKGIAAAEKSNDNQSLANGYFILGTIYSNVGEHALAIEQYLKARPFREKVGNPSFIVSDLYTISDLYRRTGEYRKGINAGREALAVAEKYNLTLKYEGTYLSLARNYEGLGDFRNASTYYRLYAMAKDTVYRNASTQAIAEMQTKYETEKKEKQLALQKAELFEQEAQIQQTNMIAAVLGVSVVLLLVIVALLRSRWRRKRQILQKERELYIREAQIQASIQSQERERKRFAQDLHDGMGQLISALRLALVGVNREAELEGRLSAVTKGEKILDEMHHEIRSIAFNLMPQTLVQHGLVPALKEMSDRMNGNGKIVIRVGSFDMPSRLTELMEISLYRVVQEWVNNVIKYANAKVIQVQLIGYEKEINVTIEDDGDGFDPAVLERGGGNGWKNIRSRLNLVGGSIEIDSRPGMGGTTVILRVPFQAAPAPGVPAQQPERAEGSPAVVSNTH